MGLYPRLYELAGVDDGPLDADAIRALGVIGDADDCERAVRALWDAGADSVVLVPPHEGRDVHVARFVADVLPRLRS
jgi:alkanesulfonate monooxygenase SsuD/methylene tetrahydromethanopterin reductase-like flavin-dependent oxidoreductase (luciferase family)